MDTKNIYLVISHSGTLVSNIVRLLTGDKYSHVSISLDDSLLKMYSFGRRKPYNPLIGRFVCQSRYSGIFKRFSKTVVEVIRLEVPAKTYYDIKRELEDMYVRRNEYKYNYLGLFLAAIGRTRVKENRFYCSEFMHYLFDKHGIQGYKNDNKIKKPVHFLNIEGGENIYAGKLTDYPVIEPTEDAK